MARKALHSSDPIIQCPVDLDSIIMQPNCDAATIEENLNVSDDILFDAIRVSRFCGWLLGLDLFNAFSKRFRQRLYSCFSAFPVASAMCFIIQIENSIHSELKLEFERICRVDDVILGLRDRAKLINPLNMLGNSVGVKWDMQVLSGAMGLVEMIEGRIRLFLKEETHDRSLTDFSSSIYLPNMLNPKFFSEQGEALQTVLLVNLDKYALTLKNFVRGGLMRNIGLKKMELDFPLSLVKHILEDGRYGLKIKLLAFKKLVEIAKTSKKVIMSRDVFDKHMAALSKKLDQKTLLDAAIWVDKNEVFEGFELDCTLHGVDSSDFLLPLFFTPDKWNMMVPLIEFQDDKRKLELYSQVGDALVAFV